jgi:phosphonopyruvate decarboxylase
MGSFATVGAQAPKNLIHIVLDNGVHDSTGGQATVSAGVNFAEIAIACGYAASSACDSTDGLAAALKAALAEPGPHLIHIRIKPGSLKTLGRPTVSPPEVARRFRDFLCG